MAAQEMQVPDERDDLAHRVKALEGDVAVLREALERMQAALVIAGAAMERSGSAPSVPTPLRLL